MADARQSNPLVEQFRQGMVPRDLRLMAAQGMEPNLKVVFARLTRAVLIVLAVLIGLPMVADMLILLGGGAAVIAIALVVIWLAIWLFIRMVIGWVRLLVRLGKRWCRKEIAA